MASTLFGIGVSHIPTLGAMVEEKTPDAESARVQSTFLPVRDWLAQQEVDTLVIVYNDHGAQFTLDSLPTFAIGAAASYAPADEGFGPPKVPHMVGDQELSWHLISELIPGGFDLTVCQHMDLDHGLTVPLTVLYGKPAEWPVRIVPLAVNVVQQPTPSAKRCYELGQGLGEAIASFESDRRIGVIGTGGMSHQLQGQRAGHINTEFDRDFLRKMVDEPEAIAALSNSELIRLAGSEGAELTMWFVMRGALGHDVSEVYSGYHVPVSSTAAGILTLSV